MKQKNIENLKKFDEYCQKWDFFLNQGNYKAANVYYKKIRKIYESISSSDERDLFYMEIMNNYSNLKTLSTACAQMLILNTNVEIAEKKLNQISKMENYNSSAIFSSKMILQEWKKGKLINF